MSATVNYLNPEGLHRNPAFTQAVVVSGEAMTIYVGGQNAVDIDGAIVGAGDLRAQTVKALRNLEIALSAAGGKLENVVKWTVYAVEGQNMAEGFAGFTEVWGTRPNPPAISVLLVAGLANPEFLVEIEAIAVLP